MHNRLMPFQGPRLALLLIVMFLTFGVLVSRLVEWQVFRYKEFEAGANENAIQAVPLPAARGVIYDRNGVGLAFNSPAFIVSVVPAGLPDDPDDALKVLN